MTSEWHPIFLTTEIRPGVWEMQHATSPDPFGKIEIRRVGDAVRYKVTLRGAVIGWSTTLQVACEQLYLAWLEANQRMREGPPNGRG